MRIVSLSNHHQDGLGYQEYYLLKAWQEMGHEVHCVTSDVHFEFPDYDKTVKHIIGEKYVGAGLFYTDFGVPVHRLPSTRRFKRIWIKGLKSKILSLKPDILVIHSIFTFQTIRVSFWAKKLNCKIIVDDHTNVLLVKSGRKSIFAYKIFKNFFANRINRMSEKIVATTATTIKIIEDNFGIDKQKIDFIPLGTDTNLFYKSESLRKKGRDLFKIPDDVIFIVYTGKMYEVKKVHLILNALNDADVTFGKQIVIGLIGEVSDSYFPVLDKAMKESVCPIIYNKAVSQDVLPLIYNAADIAVWPASLTISTIDASACGCPIIISNHMPERVKNKNGIEVEDGNLDDLKVALKRLIHNKKEREEMGNRGVLYVQSELSWNIIAKRFIES